MREERSIRSFAVFVLVGALCGVAPRAHALELRLGVKGALTLSGMIGVEPATIPLAPWHDSSIGAGFGGGVYADLHFNRLLGLELDVLVEGNRIFYETFSGNELLEQAVVYEQLRVPILFKLIAPLGRHAEFTGAFGPELLFGVGATPHSALYPPRRFDKFYGADEQFGLGLAAAVGFGFKTKYLHIPIELRFGYNMLGAYSYDDRVNQIGEDIYVLQAIENYQFALMVGFGFRIPPEQPPKPPKPTPAKEPEVDDPFYYPDPPEGSPPRVRRPW